MLRDIEIPEIVQLIGHPIYTCDTCGKKYPVYSLKKGVWTGTGTPCIRCFESRIGRKLRTSDLNPEAAANYLWIKVACKPRAVPSV